MKNISDGDKGAEKANIPDGDKGAENPAQKTYILKDMLHQNLNKHLM